MVRVSGLAKSFTFHGRGGATLRVLDGVSFEVARGECVALDGPSGAGKSTLMRTLYGNYRPEAGSIEIRHDEGGAMRMVDLAVASPRAIIAVRRRTLGYVSQFLRVIPRVTTLEIVAQPLLQRGVERDAAMARAGEMLSRLDVPSALWDLPPATFSGGEQQRVNLARGLVTERPVLLLDEPTASLDAANVARVLALLTEVRDRGAAIIGIFHDAAVRGTLATRTLPITRLATAA